MQCVHFYTANKKKSTCASKRENTNISRSKSMRNERAQAYLPDNSHHPSSSIRSHRNVIAALLNPNVHDSPVKEVQ